MHSQLQYVPYLVNGIYYLRCVIYIVLVSYNLYCVVNSICCCIFRGKQQQISRGIGEFFSFFFAKIWRGIGEF